MRWECRKRFPPRPTSKETASKRSRHASRHVRHTRAVMHVGIAYPRWRGKRSRHSRRMRTRKFTYLSRGPLVLTVIITLTIPFHVHPWEVERNRYEMCISFMPHYYQKSWSQSSCTGKLPWHYGFQILYNRNIGNLASRLELWLVQYWSIYSCWMPETCKDRWWGGNLLEKQYPIPIEDWFSYR